MAESRKTQKEKLNKEMLCFRLGNLGLLIGLILFVPLRYTYYFETCDDYLIQDILSGRYTGQPDSYNVQVLFLLSTLLKGLYSIAPKVEWFSLILLVCQYGSLFLVTDRLITLIANKWIRIASVVAYYVTILTFFLGRLIVIQYTVTAAMLGGAACFLLLTSALKEKSLERVMISNVGGYLSVFLAINLRPDMMLLLLPYAGLALVMSWLFLEHPFSFKTIIILLANFAVIIGIVGASLISEKMYIHRNGYSDFVEYYDARTDLYDFSRVYFYEEAKDFYDSINISREQYKLIERKNFGLDEEITANTFESIGNYYFSVSSKASTLEKLRATLSAYRHRFDTKQDRPFSLIIGALWVTVFASSLVFFVRKDYYKGICSLACMCIEMVGRSILWMFLLWRDRYPDRITDSMNYAETILIAAFLLMVSYKLNEQHCGANKKYYFYEIIPVCFLGWLLIMSLYTLPFQVSGYADIVKSEEEENEPYFDLIDYFSEHPDAFYWIDTVSVMNYREPLFYGENRFENYDMMGSWITTSAVYEKKLQNAGLDDMFSSMISDNVFFVIDKDENPEWLVDFYGKKDIAVGIYTIEDVADTFSVYKLCVME